MSYNTSPFLSNIFVEKPSRRIIWSGGGRVNERTVTITKKPTTPKTTPINISFATVSSLVDLILFRYLEKPWLYRYLLTLFHLAMNFIILKYAVYMHPCMIK